jgi:hypothetical protein
MVDDQGTQGLPDEATLTLTVHAPIATEPRTFTWKRNTMVAEAAREVAQAFGYEGGTPSLQHEDGSVLDGDSRLATAKLKDGDVLELVDVGGGV